MLVTTTFVLSNATRSIEATAYLSRYLQYHEDIKTELLFWDKDLLSIDGFFENPHGKFQPCPLFQVTLVNEFLEDNNINMADTDLYSKELFLPKDSLYLSQ